MLIKLMILMLLGAFVGLFFVKGPDGNPLMSVEDLKPETPAVVDIPQQPTEVYKWQDENGVWQFSNNPVDSDGAEVLELDGKINAIASFEIPSEDGSVNVGKTQASKAVASLPSGLTSVSPEKISEMMDTVNNLEQSLEQRKVDMDKALGKEN